MKIVSSGDPGAFELVSGISPAVLATGFTGSAGCTAATGVGDAFWPAGTPVGAASVEGAVCLLSLAADGVVGPSFLAQGLGLSSGPAVCRFVIHSSKNELPFAAGAPLGAAGSKSLGAML